MSSSQPPNEEPTPPGNFGPTRDHHKPESSDSGGGDDVTPTMPPETKPPSAVSRFLVRVSQIVLLIALVTMLLTVSSLAGRHYWLLDVFTNFRFIYAEILVISLIVAALRQKWFWSTLILICLMINLAYIAPLYLPASAVEMGLVGQSDEVVVADDVRPLKLLHINVNNQNPNIAGVANYILQSDADLVFLQEVNTRWLKGLEETISPYSLHTPRPRSDPFGIALFVNTQPTTPFTLVNATIIDLSNINIPAIEANVRIGTQSYAVLSVHAHPPFIPVSLSSYDGWMTEIRNKQLQAAYNWATEQSSPPIVIGDLNATPFSYTLRDIMNPPDVRPALIYSQQGLGYQPSWPAQLPNFLRIPIDHCLISPRLQVEKHILGPKIGSDHLPLYVEVKPHRPVQ